MNTSVYKKREKKSAFTLMEIMLAVVILGVLATLVGPGILKKMDDLKVNATKTTLQNIKAALMDYNMNVGHFPTKREGGLDALLEKPNVKGSEKWNGPYLSGKKDVPQDNWSRDIDYNVAGAIQNKEYQYFELISYGKDGQPGGEGVNAELTAGE